MVELIILLVIVGAALYLVELIPIDSTIKRVIQVIVIVFVIIYALRLLAPSLPGLG
jgi:hypothetical protein